MDLLSVVVEELENSFNDVAYFFLVMRVYKMGGNGITLVFMFNLVFGVVFIKY